MNAQQLLLFVFVPALACATMPASRQNELVRTYCTVCHTDAARNGGLSLEHFDAANPDPGVAAMLASKLKGKAMGASGKHLPDRATQDALLEALTAEGARAGEWFVTLTTGPRPVLSASIVRTAASAASEGEPDLYRLTLTCHPGSHDGEIQLAWSPGVPPQGQPLSAVIDGGQRLEYRVEGMEKMGNGGTVMSGPGALILNADRPLPLSARTLTVSGLFPGGKVEFPFGDMPGPARQPLSSCFAAVK